MSKAVTVNAALRQVANQRAADRMLELLDETGADLSDGARRVAGRRPRLSVLLADKSALEWARR